MVSLIVLCALQSWVSTMFATVDVVETIQLGRSSMCNYHQ